MTTDETLIKLTVNKFVYLMITVILVTNTVSLTVQRVNNNEDKHVYLDQATRRRIEHAVKEEDYKHQLLVKDVEIRNLKQYLDDCKK